MISGDMLRAFYRRSDSKIKQQYIIKVKTFKIIAIDFKVGREKYMMLCWAGEKLILLIPRLGIYQM